MKRVMTRLTLLLLAASPLGCGVGRPAIPPSVRHSVTVYTTAELEKHRCLYEEAVTGLDCKDHTAARTKDPELARFWRDTMINLIRRDIESFYHEYETRLADGRRRFTSAVEVTSLAGVAAATITNGARAKTVIATMVSFVEGAQGKIDQNIFRERTTDVIIQKMRASRARVETLVIRKMAQLDARRYVFSDAERDLRELFWAGTLQGGFLELALDAGNDAAQAAAEKKSAEETVRRLIPIATSANRTFSGKVRKKIDDLEIMWRDNQNTPAGRGAAAAALAALNLLKQRGKLKFTDPLPDASAGQKIFDLLNDEMEDALFTPNGLREKLPVIAEALGVN